MKFFIEKTTSKEAFVLFHGTGGNEFNFLFLTGELNPQANVISFLGDVSTGVNRRFFAPLKDNQLDVEDYDNHVNRFLEEWQEMALSFDKITFIGYSNGANFIQGILNKAPNIADEVILMHPQNFRFTFEKSERIKRVLLITGANDPMIVPGDIVQLKQEMVKVYSDVTLTITDGQHGVTDEEIDEIKKWYKS
ncbi:alpha/beta hydrolase [Vagococcus fluvialis]|uniref:alpha/beta hydrolase n=1 Tax=Vagococcus fluvialis TaxID=2738 RepID=UPI003B591A82